MSVLEIEAVKVAPSYDPPGGSRVAKGYIFVYAIFICDNGHRVIMETTVYI